MLKLPNDDSRSNASLRGEAQDILRPGREPHHFVAESPWDEPLGRESVSFALFDLTKLCEAGVFYKDPISTM
ncbi:MAG: hypothetical protein M3Q55_00155 [Acidobacteriota bacterium]|nr:hypothetical protein [Acidobacteriota bacterium]